MISWRDLSRFGCKRDGRIGAREGATETGDARSRFTNGGTDGRKDHCQFLAGPSILNRVQSIRRKGDDNSLSPRSEENCFVVARDYCYQVSPFIFVTIAFYCYFFFIFFTELFFDCETNAFKLRYTC